MRTGANRKIIGTSAFFLNRHSPEPLGTVARTDFAVFPEAERDIVCAFVKYKSLLSSFQNAPTSRERQEQLGRLARTVEICRDQMRAFLQVGKDHNERFEYRAAICELLLDHNIERLSMDSVIEQTIDNLAQLHMFLMVATQALDARVRKGELVEVSSLQARHDFFRPLRAILKRHGLDDRIGENSLIVHLVIRLEEKWVLTAKSGLKASRETNVDRRIRKDLAAEIKAAVKAQKGG